MNQLMLLVLGLAALCYFGGNYCPAVLRQNKKMLLGVVVGLALCSFFGMHLEGMSRIDGVIEKVENIVKEERRP
jgi:drug/metabolite transporter superfamily protein YnfA